MNSKDTTYDKKTIAHVIRIVNDHTIIIDAGKKRGLKEGDEVQVYDVTDEIFNLDGEKIDNYRFIKATLFIDTCEDNYSICKTYSYSVPTASSMVSQLATSPLLSKKSEQKKLLNAKIYDILNQIFNTALENELVVQNPMTGIKKPQGRTPKKRRALTSEERGISLKVANYHRGGLFILLMLYCGLRPQEIVPLQWSDIDFASKRVIVNKALKSDGIVRGFTKTKAGMRSIPIPGVLLDRLIAEHDDVTDDSLLICANTRGERYTKSSINDLWKNFKREMNIAAGCKVHPQKHQVMPPYFVQADLTLYCYRHTYCTDLQAAGVPINVAKELMGHEDIAVTSKIYTHKSDVALNNAAELIDKYSRGV